MRMTPQSIYTVKENKEFVVNTLESSQLALFTWFNNNFMKANCDKSQLLLSCSEPSTALIDGSPIESNTKEEEQLGIRIAIVVTIDRDLKFDDHVNNHSKKVCQKLKAVACLAPFMNTDKKN